MSEDRDILHLASHPAYAGQCGVCGTEYESDVPYSNGVFCSLCRKNKLIAPGIVNFVPWNEYVPMPISEFPHLTGKRV
jgi:hypothetical protein